MNQTENKDGPGPLRRAYFAIAPFLVVPFILLTVIFCVAGAVVLLSASPFVAFVYGLLVFLVMCSLVIGARFFKRASATTSFLQDIIGVDRKERKRLVDNAVTAIKRESVSDQTNKNRKQFYKTALFVTVYLVVIGSIIQTALGAYPRDIFLLPLEVLVLFWFLVVWLLPRLGVIIILLSVSGFGSALMLLGPAILVQILPLLIMFPLMMIMNFLMMFGPLAFFNIKQIQFIKPGEANWGISIDDVRGQDDAKKQVIAALRMIASTEGEKLKAAGGKAPRGLLFKGPPGTGKTLMAKAIASMLNAPVVITTGAAFQATFIGIDVLVMMYLRVRTEGLAKEFGRAVCFIDEAELLMRSRGGENTGAGTGISSASMWDVLSYDAFGAISTCGLVFDTEQAREIFWHEKFPEKYAVHPQMFPGGMMGMGGGAAIYPFLTWLDGITSPPFWPRFLRSRINLLLDIALVIPPAITIRGKYIPLRLPAAKPADPKNLLFIAATNRPHVLDAAMLRAGRFGTHITFKTPGEEERADIIDLYFGKILHYPDLDSRIDEFARTTTGLSPADLEQVIRDSITYRNDHIHRLSEIKRLIELGKESELDASLTRFWETYHKELNDPNWDTIWATWDSLMESLSAKRYGLANPHVTTQRHRKMTAYHEVGGHLVPLAYFGGDWMRPTTVSVMPRGNALGLVSHVPIEEYDPEPQEKFDALVRVSVGSTVAERVFFGDNQPGVSSDLDNATRLEAAMVEKLGMVPRKCLPDEQKRYIRIGETVLTSGGQMNAFGMLQASAPMKHNTICLMLGQAFVDSWRLISKNQDIIAEVAEQLLRQDEIVGKDLEDVWTRLRTGLRPLTAEDKQRWPDREVEPESPFYKETPQAVV